MLESFALNGRVGDIGIKDKTIEVKLVFPNDERTQDELAFLFPIKKGLATVRIIAAVNKGYAPGRRRSDRDETGTPLLPGVDMNEICHACGKTVDCVNEPFFAKPVEGGKEIILCGACYMVPQPETIETKATPTTEGEAGAVPTPTCEECLNFKEPPGEAVLGVCTVHAGDPMGAYKEPGEIACDKFAAKPLPMEAEEPPIPEPAPDSTPEQLEAAADTILEGAPPVPKVCALCGHAHGERYRIDGEDGKAARRVWKTIENDQGVFEQCPKCAHLNQFPEEGGGKEGGAAA